MITLGIIYTIYGILQVYTNLSFIMHSKIPYMASSLCGNPNFFGSYMVMLTSYTFAMYMLEKEKKYFFLSLIFFIGLCLASSSGPFISFIIIIIFLLIAYRKKIILISLIITLKLIII